MNKIKVFYFEQLYTKYVVELCKIISSSDEFDITYLYGMTTGYWLESKINTLNYREMKIPSVNLPIKSGTRGTHYEVLSVRFVFRFLKTRPNVLVIDPSPAFSCLYLFFGRLAGCKIIGVPTSLPDNSFWGKLSNFILKRNDCFIDRYIVPSNIKKEMMVGMGISHDKIMVIGHGIDTSKFHATKDNNIVFPEGKKIILFVGRFVEYKGIKYLLESFDMIRKKIDNVCLVLIGNGPQKKEIDDLIKKRDLSKDVHQISNINNTEMPKYYSKADILAVPSIEPEPFGLVYIEGMSCGIPIVTFDVRGGERDLIQNEKNGILVELKNVGRFADALALLLSDDSKRMQMGENGKEFVIKNYDLRVNASRWRKEIRDLIQ